LSFPVTHCRHRTCTSAFNGADVYQLMSRYGFSRTRIYEIVNSR